MTKTLAQVQIQIHNHTMHPQSTSSPRPRKTINTLTSNILIIYSVYLETNQVIEFGKIHLKTMKLNSPMRKTTKITSTNTPPLSTFIHNHTPRDNPQVFIYTNGSFIPLDEHDIGSLANSNVYNPTNNSK